MFYLYTGTDKKQIAFACVNPHLVLRIFINSPSRKNRLSLPEINFIRKNTFELNYYNSGNLHNSLIKRLRPDDFREHLKKTFGNIWEMLSKILPPETEPKPVEKIITQPRYLPYRYPRISASENLYPRKPC
jgi:hypothetical protein